MFISYCRHHGIALVQIVKINSDQMPHYFLLNRKKNGNFLKNIWRSMDMVYLKEVFSRHWEKILRIMLITGTTYWTSGIYDPSKTLWKWTVNHHPLPSLAPWGHGYPSKPNTLLRVLLYYTNRYNANWQTVSSTQLHRYICEVNEIRKSSNKKHFCEISPISLTEPNLRANNFMFLINSDTRAKRSINSKRILLPNQ